MQRKIIRPTWTSSRRSGAVGKVWEKGDLHLLVFVSELLRRGSARVERRDKHIMEEGGVMIGPRIGRRRPETRGRGRTTEEDLPKV